MGMHRWKRAHLMTPHGKAHIERIDTAEIERTGGMLASLVYWKRFRLGWVQGSANNCSVLPSSGCQADAASARRSWPTKELITAHALLLAHKLCAQSVLFAPGIDATAMDRVYRSTEKAAVRRMDPSIAFSFTAPPTTVGGTLRPFQ